MNDLFEKSIKVLELPQVLEKLSGYAVSDNAKERCLTLRPSKTLYECEKRQQETADAYFLSGALGSPSFGGLRDMSGALERAEKGGMLNMGELLDIAALLTCARTTNHYLADKRGNPTSLDQLFYALEGNKYLEDKIRSSIIRIGDSV